MLRILLVDDNILNSKIIAYYLQEKYSVTCVYSGKEAVNIFKDQSFDAIILDIMMPEMDGYDTARAIRKIEVEEKRDKLIPIVALTANVYDNDREKCLNAGMNDFMVKPINMTILQNIFNELGLTDPS
jgi:CheY-like chemotaxis protein